MIVLFSFVLVHTVRTSKIRFILGLSVLFILSNACNLTQNIIGDFQGGLTLRLIFLALAQSTLNSGHWWFCYEYFDCAFSLSYKIRNEDMPRWKRCLINTVFITLMIVQALMPLAYCFVILAWTKQWFGVWHKNYDLVVRWFFSLWTVSLLGQLAQAIVLIIGIIKLKIIINKSGYSRMVNNWAFAIHFTIFFLYIGIMYILYLQAVSFFLAISNSKTPPEWVAAITKVRISVTLVSFFFQLILFLILWRMDHQFNHQPQGKRGISKI